MPIIRDDELPSNAGHAAEVEARPAASTIVLRRHPFEILFLRRSSASTFVPDAWIFPGGAVDPVDRLVGGEEELSILKACAARELFEEAGIWIGPELDDAETWRARLLDEPGAFAELSRISPPDLERLVWTSRWVTPVGIPKRYDTWFFLLEVEDASEATAEHREGVEVRWLAPAEALRLHGEGAFSMVFPTIRNLQALAAFESARELLEARRDATIPTTRPVLIVEGGKKRLVLPDEG
jgi:8-oxo-dGTP pyrophosphatase MutT (NUDIX family)